ncbi:MAG TPA: glycoside hydrolase family 13 protein [Actinomycetaceae bacterium]|nr:glycoside hydrolase family 13 protein [Actinomycetaceae bacterium]
MPELHPASLTAADTPATDAVTASGTSGASDASGASGASRRGREWWRHSVIYQVYPRSYASSGGPLGDLRGITSRLGHLRDLGVDALWLSPFYRSPQKDGGYDVSDYRDIDPLFGTLADAEEMIERAHDLGLRVIVDLVPNHTSDQHEWFRAALRAGPGSPERARYWFRDGGGDGTDGGGHGGGHGGGGHGGGGHGGGDIPNNWRSVFGGPAWTRVSDREDAHASPWQGDRQWYLNLFDSSQPDLNWENPEVREEFRSILRFWLDRGVDGFRVDVAHGLVKDPALPDWEGRVHMVEGVDEPVRGPRPIAPMYDQPGVHEIYREWREVLEEYEGDRALVAEAWVEPESQLAKYVRHDEMHQAFNFPFLTSEWNADRLREVIATSYAANDAVGAPTTWVMSNHDVIRHSSRLGMAYTGKKQNGIGAEDPQPDNELGLRRAKSATLLMFGLAGSVYIYQGEELGLPEHSRLPDELRQDPAFHRTDGEEKGRDGCRVPIPWEAEAPAFGFSPDGASWLPQPAEWSSLAVDAQTGRDGSTLEFYRSALALRRQWDLGLAELTWDPDFDDAPVIAFYSRAPGVGRPGAGASDAGRPDADRPGAGDSAAPEALRPEVRVLSTFGETVPVPWGWDVAISSSPVKNGMIGTDTTVWLVPGSPPTPAANHSDQADR